MTVPKCPIHGEMKLIEIEQGDVSLGFIWFCVEDECDECEDYESTVTHPSTAATIIASAQDEVE